MEFEKAQEELKNTLEDTQATALEQAKLKCQRKTKFGRSNNRFSKKHSTANC